MKNKRAIFFLIAIGFLAYTCKMSQKALKRDENGKVIVNPHPSPAYLSPGESMKTIYLQKGYHLELVASEPMVSEPVAIAWDPNGRLYVAEMNTYMQDVDGTGEEKPVCKIKRLEDTNGDGKMDKVTVFIDSLVLPRMILPLDDRVLVSETYTQHIYSYRDTNGDGVADEKKMAFYNDKITKANLEHQKSGLVWNLDNRMYVTVEGVRYRYVNGQLAADSLHEPPGGQWGLANDDYGRLFFSSAGGEIPALNFQQNPDYGRLDFKDQLDEGFQAVWPIIATPDVQGGQGRLRPDSTLNHFTASCGQSIYRGNKLPADLKGDYIICEPVGRLVRRAKVINQEGKILLKNAYDKEEFIASTDMNFRPVSTATGPDGCLYIVDMYRGIIQESNWTRNKSYLRPQILRKGLDKNIGRGRIYRVVYDKMKPSRMPHMLNESSADLVNYLAHPNGWWRDNAQKLLVIRGDKSIVPALKKMAANPDHLGRIHALWTLQGLNELDKATLYRALKDEDARVRKTAIWISEGFLKAGDLSLLDQLEALKSDPSADVRFQLALTLRYIQTEKAQTIIKDIVQRYPEQIVLVQSQKKYEEAITEKELRAKMAKQMSEQANKLINQGATFFKQLCATCHGGDGKGLTIGGQEMPAPPLAESKTVNGDHKKVIRILLHGLTGPVDGKTYKDNLMPALGANDDEYIASVISYIRNNFGNKASVVTPADVKKIRQETTGRANPWTKKELEELK